MTPEFTILAIHGNGGGAFRFERVRPHIPPEVTFTPVTLPGFADVPRDPRLTSLTHYAEHLHGLIRTIPRPRVVLGTGIGGSIVLEYLQEFEAALDAAILHAPVGTRLASRLFPRLMAVPGMRAAGQWAVSSRLTRPIFRSLFFSTGVPREYTDRFFDEYRQCRVFSQMFDIITPEWFAGLKPVNLPTGLLWGARERVLKVTQLDDYKQLCPRHVVRIVPDWDHFPMIDRPGDFAAEIIALSKELLAKC